MPCGRPPRAASRAGGSLRLMDDLAADDCERSAAGERPARERRVAAFREEPCGMHGPARGDVQHDDVGGRFGFQRSARKPKCDGGCGAHAKDQLGERQHSSPYELRMRSEEHTSELQSLAYLVCRLLLEKKKKQNKNIHRVERVLCGTDSGIGADRV